MVLSTSKSSEWVLSGLTLILWAFGDLVALSYSEEYLPLYACELCLLNVALVLAALAGAPGDYMGVPRRTQAILKGAVLVYWNGIDVKTLVLALLPAGLVCLSVAASLWWVMLRWPRGWVVQAVVWCLY